MKKCQLKNGRRVLLLLGIGILTFAVSFQSKAQVADPGPLVTVTLSGTEYLEDVMLAQVGDYDKIHEVTNLKVVGGILSSSDIWFLTEHMAYDADNSGKGKLVRLDLSDVGRIGTNSVDAGVLSLIAVKELILPNTVQILDGNAFMNSKIEYLTLGRDTWKVCGSLFDEETDPKNYYSAFSNLNYLKKVFVAEGNTHFQSVDGILFDVKGEVLYAYPAARPDNEYTVPATVKEIAPCAFMGTNLDKIDFSNVEIIGGYAFANFASLQEIVWGNGLKYIAANAFSRALSSDLSTHSDESKRVISLPEGLLYIGKEAFVPTLGFERFELPSTLTYIGSAAFAGDGIYYSTLKTLDFSKCANLQVIPQQLCYYANQLKEIKWPENGVLHTIEYGAFFSCSGLRTLRLPESVETIGQMAFFMYDEINPSMLEEVRIGSKVKTIEANAFGKLYALKHFIIEASVPPVLDSEGPAFVYTPVRDNILYVPASAIDTYKNTDQYKRFGKIASVDSYDRTSTGMGLSIASFAGADSLQTIFLPKNTKYVEEEAFMNCPNLQNLFILSDSPEFFGNNAFPDRQHVVIWVVSSEMKERLDGQFAFRNTQVKVLDLDGIDNDATNAAVTVKVVDRRLVVTTQNKADINIYDLQGVRHAGNHHGTAATSTFDLRGGVYVVKVNQTASKVVIPQ